MPKSELSSSNALLKSAVFICGGSKRDIGSIWESAQTGEESVAELQADAHDRAGEG